MSRTNDAITDDGKAVDANKRNKERPEGADHLPLKDEADHASKSDHNDEEE